MASSWQIVQVSRQANGKERTNPICKVQGTWLGYVEFSKAGTKDQFEKYWEMGKMQPVRPIPVENPLPSDCRYREDLIKLAEGDEDASQESVFLLLLFYVVVVLFLVVVVVVVVVVVFLFVVVVVVVVVVVLVVDFQQR